MSSATLLVSIGILFLAGLVLDRLGRQTHVPRVTLLILLGAAVGPSALDLLPTGFYDANDLLTPTALTMVAFLLGGTLHRDTLRSHGREILIVSLSVVVISVLLVAGGLALLGLPLPVALLLGGIAAATAPAATTDVIRQSGSKGRFATNILGIVAIDDAWGVLVFSGLLALTGVLLDGTVGNHLWHGVREITGAVGLGFLIGLPAAFLTGRIKPGEPTLIEALGLVFLCAGLALWLDISFLLAGIVCGAVVVNLAKHHERPFHEIERLEWPFLLLFFVMAGAALETGKLAAVGFVAVFYITLRIIARIIGAGVGGALAGLPRRESALTGLALMPQAGVAVGMALMVRERFPDLGEPILAVTIAATIFFELIGPLLTQYALRHAKE